MDVHSDMTDCDDRVYDNQETTRMTTAEVAVRDQHDMPAKIQYAKLLAESGLLPASYRKQPANILYAVEYGELLGLPAIAAITGIHVIEGKPSISAGLISALVRRAGHRLRVIGDDTIRDVPDHPR